MSEPHVPIGDSPKPILWHVLAMFAVLLLGPLLAALLQGDGTLARILVSVGLTLVSLSLARWHHAHRETHREGELGYYRLALVFLTVTGGFGYWFTSSVVSGLLLLATFVGFKEQATR
jgi:hypothetical protein